MCQGTITAFICGHLLITFSSDKPETQCTPRCKIPSSPATFAQDTCAECHPEHRVRELKRRLDRQFTVYSVQLVQADGKGDHKLAWEIRQKIKTLHAGYLVEVEEARRVGMGCPEVVWPGKKDEA
ncbi:hypothetical protein OQA88_7832 [Cercophora sp. LCS_1]